MGMRIVIGGAFSGKRKIVKEMNRNLSWLSAYKGDVLSEWEERWTTESMLVIEGWEIWLANELRQKENGDIRSYFQSVFKFLKEEEQKRDNDIVLIMLEVGRGIVPFQNDQRKLRDFAGWIAQDAANIADEVHYVWNGFSKRLK